ncbi:MAG: FtsK/SpoIIIE domain-containing protein [Archangium sp.]|nr:FtsK/SpoIIIE domain-containing protein [Archangium sp.]
MSATVVGRFTASQIKARLLESGKDVPSLRVVGFKRQEIVAFLEAFDGFRLPTFNKPVSLIVTGEAWPELQERYRLPEGLTVTRYRNNNDSGLVIVELEEPPDAQGLRNMTQVSDRRILPNPDDEKGWEGLVGEAWALLGSRKALPAALTDGVRSVYRAVSPLGVSFLRNWASYLSSVCGRLGAKGKAVDEKTIWQALGAELPALDMFEDTNLREETKPQERSRRLVRNRHLGQRRTPKGKEVPDEELFRRIENTQFRGADESPLPAPQQEIIRAAAKKIVDSAGRRDFSSVSYEHWLQLFENEPEQDGLGALVRAQLERIAPARVPEFEALGVEHGLDQEEADAAETMMEQGADLLPLLPVHVQTKLARIATPATSAVDDPLRKILELVQDERAEQRKQQEHGEPASSERLMELVLDNAEDAQASLALFRFLFGPTLRTVERASRDGFDWRLVCAPAVVQAGSLVFPPIQTETEADSEVAEFDVRTYWKPLRLVVRVSEAGKPGRVLGRFEWRPLEQSGLVLLGRLVIEGASAPVRIESEQGFDQLLERALNPSLELFGRAQLSPPERSTATDWLSIRQALFVDLREQGLETDRLESYVDEWAGLLERTTTECIPRGAAHPGLEAFLDIDVGQLDESIVMLATHPLRLRWVAAHLRQISKSLTTALSTGLDLNPVNDELYFDSLAELSPHSHPPVLCARNQTLAVATREVGWHEEFAAIKKETASSSDWLSAIDDGSTDAMAQVVRQYLDAYPHKVDGLSLLVLLRDGDTKFVERMLSRIRQREFADAEIELHVFAPLADHFAIARAVARADEEEERTSRLLPRVQTILHVWKDVEALPQLSAVGRSIDLALVPNLFSRAAQALDETRPNLARPGRFDPWRDSPSHIARAQSDEARINVTRVLLPEAPDSIFELWSTLCVWRSRSRPVGEAGAANTDFVTLQVRFDKNSHFFDELHEIAQWVVTLDPFIGREQIEALPQAPDVITVHPRVGKNGMYTLVVSSRAGQRFLVERLARRLHLDLGPALQDGAQKVAGELYKIGRHLAPGVLLRALGLGHTMQELLGLLILRKAVEETLPANIVEGFEAWVSLDEHTGWFGGPQAVRADMLRVIGRREDNKLKLDIDVLEAKYRTQEELGRADEQIRVTSKLVQSAFRPSVVDHAAADGPFWRRELLSAIDQSSRRVVDGDDFSALLIRRGGQTVTGGLSDELRDEIRQGNYELGSVRGIACTIGVSTDIRDRQEDEKTPEGAVRLRIGRSDVLRLLGNKSSEGGGPASPPAGPDVPPRPPAEAGRPGAPPPLAPAPPPQTPAAHPVAPQMELEDSAVEPRTRAGLGTEGLEAKYQLLLDAFHELSVGVERPSGMVPYSEGPGFFALKVRPRRGVRVDTLLSRLEDLKLRMELDGDRNIRHTITEGLVVFEFPKSTNDGRYPVYAEDLWERSIPRTDILYASLGEDALGQVVGLDFSDDTPHLLIAGTTGSGKSSALDTLLNGLARSYPPERLRFVLVDPKGVELVGFENDPHLQGSIGTSAEDAIQFLSEAVDEMQRRYALFREVGARKLTEYNQKVATPLPWIVVVLDEYSDLTSDKDDRKKIEEKLLRIAQKARAAGIHLIVATQRPTAEIINTTIRSNLPAQLALRVSKAADSRIIMEETGAEALAGKGDALLRTAKGITRLQCAIRRDHA